MEVGRRGFLKGLLATMGAAVAASIPPPPPLWVPPEPRVFQLDRTMLQGPPPTVEELVANALEDYNRDLMGVVNRHMNLGHGVVSVEGIPVATMRSWTMDQRFDPAEYAAFGQPYRRGPVRRTGHLEGFVMAGPNASLQLAHAFEESKEVSVQVHNQVFTGHIEEIRWGSDGSVSFEAALRRVEEHVGGAADLAHGDGLYRGADGPALHLPTRAYRGRDLHGGPPDPDDWV